MAIYTIEDTTTGQVFKIEGPEGASDYELQQFMSTQFQEEEEEPVDDDIGLGRGIIHGMTRAGVQLITAPKQMVGEQLAQISDLKRDRLAREADGDVSALSRLMKHRTSLINKLLAICKAGHKILLLLIAAHLRLRELSKVLSCLRMSIKTKAFGAK